MKTSAYSYLIGKDKQNVIIELGSEFNYFHSEIWTYHIKTNWFGKKFHLLIFFKNEIVHKVQIKKTYAKLGY
jgi:hypothetical protein